MEERSEIHYLCLRGLPWSASKQDIHEFLKNVNICEGENSILFTVSEQGKRSGDALVLVPTKEDSDKALTYNRNYIGKRYIEVLLTTRDEYESSLEKATLGDNDFVVRMRGLPFSTTESEIRDFFGGLEIAPRGLILLTDRHGTCTGDAYVEFVRTSDAKEAIKKHRDRIGTRFIEVYKSSKSEMLYMGNIQPVSGLPPDPRLDRGYNDSPREYREEYSYGPLYRRPPSEDPRIASQYLPRVTIERYVHMRGLPYSISIEEIEDFFYPVPTVSIGMCFTEDGRPTGECDVFFSRESDVLRSLNKHKHKIGKRYAELFLRTRRMFPTPPRREMYPPREEFHESSLKAPNIAYDPNRAPYDPSYSAYLSEQHLRGYRQYEYCQETNPIPTFAEHNSPHFHQSGYTSNQPLPTQLSSSKTVEYYSEPSGTLHSENPNKESNPTMNYVDSTSNPTITPDHPYYNYYR